MALSRQIAEDEELLGIASHVRRPPVPNVFLAAVHFLLAEAPEHELSAFYATFCDNPRPPAEAYPAFRDFVLSNTTRLIPLLDTRITQTNEVGRCSFLLPAFTAVHRSASGRPLALDRCRLQRWFASSVGSLPLRLRCCASGRSTRGCVYPLRSARPRHAAAAGELSRVPFQGRDRSQPRRLARSDRTALVRGIDMARARAAGWSGSDDPHYRRCRKSRQPARASPAAERPRAAADVSPLLRCQSICSRLRTYAQ